jgi:hypothetical protein
MLTHGEHADAVQKQVEDQKLPYERWPKFLRDRPSLLPGLEIYYNAFMDLSTCRNNGMGVGPIPITAIYEYCDRQGFDEDICEALFDHVRAMDSEFIRHHNSKIDSARK